jgi:hypothetical protein
MNEIVCPWCGESSSVEHWRIRSTPWNKGKPRNTAHGAKCPKCNGQCVYGTTADIEHLEKYEGLEI